MNYISTKEAAKIWHISERRIRKLLNDGRIDGAIKVGNTWNIPSRTTKPTDKRYKKLNDDFIINLDDKYFNNADNLNNKLNEKRPLPKSSLNSLQETINLFWTYNSNAIEGNTLTLRETQVVLEGITIGGKTVKEHLETINHQEAILFLNELVNDNNPISEWNIKNIHQIVLKNIDNSNAGKYRDVNVTIKGAKHIPPDFLLVPEMMEKLILRYRNWQKFHPIIKACLLHGEFVKIHPFIDGNGRCARLIMNLSLMHDGFLPVIIKKEKRIEYYNALDKAHTTKDYTNFIKLINNLEIEMLNKYLEILK